MMKFLIKKLPGLLSLSLLLTPAVARPAGEVTIIDSKHYSIVMGEVRNFRIFLPPGYFDLPQKKYPVIYFFHGWSQRYFGSSNAYADFDKGDENKGDNIAKFVSTHDVIVVKADGYNRSPDEKYYVRPYNVGPVETYRQFPLYFPELVDHIDNHYNTIADREHRAISGLSMGGFMTFWIGGKYPHLLSAAGNFCGSPEFVVGPKDFPVELRHLDFYKNYAGMNVRLHYGDKDFIRGYHQDMNRVWAQVIDNYDWKIYDAEHSTCGMGDMFAFLMKTFENPPPRPLKWDHIDVYPKFSVWDYEISSDRNVPGFTVLENVNKRGFKCSVREFLPDGELLPFVNVSIRTSPVYEKNTSYTINDVELKSLKTSGKTIRSDGAGRLTILLNGGAHEIGINNPGDKPNITVASVEITNGSWATSRKDIVFAIKLLNKGMASGRNISAKLSTVKNNVNVKQGASKFGSLDVNQVQVGQTPFAIQVPGDTIEVVKLKLAIQDENKNEWVEFVEIPIRKEVPEIKDFEIADGKTLTVVSGGIDTTTVLLGSGNGDGIANPGESIVVLVKDQNKFWRTDLFSSDPYINPFGVSIRKSDYWGNYDHVGGSAKYDIPLIASNCPENHPVTFFAEYWLPDNPLHIIKQGIITINVKGKDATPPVLSWVHVFGENILYAKVYDGTKIQSVKAKLILKENAAKSLDIELKDDGKEGDRVEGDNVFSKKLAEQKFGIYRVVVEAVDAFGNKKVTEVPESFVLH